LSEINLVPRVERLLSDRSSRLARAGAGRKAGFSLKNLVGESERFLEAVELVPRLGEVDGTLLITGETGTGKELFARAIHYAGRRKGKPFVPVNCGALPDSLVENELFGHAKGAFTDASAAGKGLVGESEGGTLFLDEVEALSHAAQAKLLRFLQDHEYRPLGSTTARRADVRIVAATNVDLRAAVDARRFREDLFYRLSILLLRIPPLRDRIEDIPLLADHFAHKYSRTQGRPRPRLSVAALEMLAAHEWPGNVRELEAVIQRSVLMARDGTLEPGDIDLDSFRQDNVVGLRRFREAKSYAIESFERSYLMRVLTAHSGNISEAARAAGTDRRALQRLMRKHGIDRHEFIA
jgi:two-component system response regulator AtoC